MGEPLCVFARLELPATLKTPMAARHFAADVMLRLIGDAGRGVDSVDEVVVVVTELATNALNAHARQPSLWTSRSMGTTSGSL